MLKKVYLQFTKVIAFTLAETLIVMGIIGIVAALTLPNLNSSTGDKEKVAKVKKIYQNLNDALGRVQAVYGPVDEWYRPSSNDAIRFGERMTEFMKLSKNCGINTNQGCFSSQNASSLYGTSLGYSFDSEGVGPISVLRYRCITADGTSISFPFNGLPITIDIDGPNKGQNTVGKDIFHFMMYDGNSIEPYSIDYPKSCFSSGLVCAKWIIENDNMDYLKADSNGKCTNNTSITLDGTTNTTCK